MNSKIKQKNENSDINKVSTAHLGTLNTIEIKKEIKHKIQLNLFKSASWHLDYLNSNGYNLNFNQVKWQLQTIRNADFPSDNEFILNPFDLMIANQDSNPLPFCLVNYQFYDNYSNRVEKILIFSSEFLFNLVGSASHIYFDGTFRVAPNNFLQLFTLHAYNNISKSIVPSVFFLLTSKTDRIYEEAFNLLEILFTVRNIKPVFTHIQSDFEKASQNTFRKIFGLEIIYLGCFSIM